MWPWGWPHEGKRGRNTALTPLYLPSCPQGRIRPGSASGGSLLCLLGLPQRATTSLCHPCPCTINNLKPQLCISSPSTVVDGSRPRVGPLAVCTRADASIGGGGWGGAGSALTEAAFQTDRGNHRSFLAPLPLPCPAYQGTRQGDVTHVRQPRPSRLPTLDLLGLWGPPKSQHGAGIWATSVPLLLP